MEERYEDENEALLPNDDKDYQTCQDSSCSETKIHVYKRRWYILWLFSTFAVLQAFIWNVWSPIARSAEAVFGWKDSEIALLSNWGSITFIFVVPFSSWLIEKAGMRLPFLISTFLLAIGGVIRCTTFRLPYVTWISHVAAILGGLGGPVANGAVSELSSLWFPPNERTTATAISATSFFVGMALCFVVGPAIVTDIKPNASIPLVNLTTEAPVMNKSLLLLPGSSGIDSRLSPSIKTMKEDIILYTYIQAGAAGIIFLLSLLYFPSKPKLPPSMSASSNRIHYKQSLKELLSNRNIYFVCVPAALTSLTTTWLSLLTVIFKDLDITQSQTGWLGFASLTFATVLSFFMARVSDTFPRHMKMFLVVTFLIISVMLVWVVLLCEGWVHFSLAQIFISCIGVSGVSMATTPLIFELSCETAYPVPESITVGFLTFLSNVLGMIFTILFFIPHIRMGATWLNWVLLGATAFAIPVLALYKSQYNRLLIDDTDQEDNTTQA